MLISFLISISIVFHGQGHIKYADVSDDVAKSMKQEYGIRSNKKIKIHAYIDFDDYRRSNKAHKIVLRKGDSAAMLAHRASAYLVAQDIGIKQKWLVVGIALNEYQNQLDVNPFIKALCTQTLSLNKALGVKNSAQSWALVAYLTEVKRIKFVVNRARNGENIERQWLNARAHGWEQWVDDQCRR